MTDQFWFIQLPAGERLRKETMDDAVNRELDELVGRGWMPISISRSTSIAPVAFLLKRDGEVS